MFHINNYHSTNGLFILAVLIYQLLSVASHLSFTAFKVKMNLTLMRYLEDGSVWQSNTHAVQYECPLTDWNLDKTNKQTKCWNSIATTYSQHTMWAPQLQQILPGLLNWLHGSEKVQNWIEKEHYMFILNFIFHQEMSTENGVKSFGMIAKKWASTNCLQISWETNNISTNTDRHTDRHSDRQRDKPCCILNKAILPQRCRCSLISSWGWFSQSHAH